MNRRICSWLAPVLLALALPAWAKDDPCKSKCASFRDQCVQQCGAAKKKKAECEKQMCSMVVKQCEDQCKAGNAK